MVVYIDYALTLQFDLHEQYGASCLCVAACTVHTGVTVGGWAEAISALMVYCTVKLIMIRLGIQPKFLHSASIIDLELVLLAYVLIFCVRQSDSE